MREFRGQGTGLRRLAVGARLLYSAFLLFVVAGLAVSLLLFEDSMGFTASGATAWYRGNMDDPAATAILLEKSPRELLEITHFHLFTMPVVLLVVGHLFLLGRAGSWRAWVLGATTLLTAAHIAGPWVVWAGGPGWFMGVSGLLFLTGWLVMIGWSFWDLWRPSS